MDENDRYDEGSGRFGQQNSRMETIKQSQNSQYKDNLMVVNYDRLVIPGMGSSNINANGEEKFIKQSSMRGSNLKKDMTQDIQRRVRYHDIEQDEVSDHQNETQLKLPDNKASS